MAFSWVFSVSEVGVSAVAPKRALRLWIVHLAFNQASTDTIRVADRDAIVERHKESIGVSVEKADAVGHVGMTTTRTKEGSGNGTYSFPST